MELFVAYEAKEHIAFSFENYFCKCKRITDILFAINVLNLRLIRKNTFVLTFFKIYFELALTASVQVNRKVDSTFL